MTGQSPEEAVFHYVDSLRTTTGCIAAAPLVAQPASTDLYHIISRDGRPINLRTERGYPDIKLVIVHHCRPIQHPFVADDFVVRTTYYAYEVLDIHETEILTYHWHPAGQSHVTQPHLHLSSKVGSIQVASRGREPNEIHLADMHILTGHVLLEDVVRLLIEDFNVIPRNRHWNTILGESAEACRGDRV